MTLHELQNLLSQHADKAFQLRLPGGSTVPVSFHITEVGHVKKSFIDCGGQFHETESCQLQAWVGSDEDHRIASGKLAGILRKASFLLPDPEIPVEIEYEDGAKMTTVVGVFCSPEDEARLQQCHFEGLDFLHDQSKPVRVSVPKITAREFKQLESQLPLPEGGELALGAIPLAEARQFSKMYRYLPSYAVLEG